MRFVLLFVFLLFYLFFWAPQLWWMPTTRLRRPTTRDTHRFQQATCQLRRGSQPADTPSNSQSLGRCPLSNRTSSACTMPRLRGPCGKPWRQVKNGMGGRISPVTRPLGKENTSLEVKLRSLVFWDARGTQWHKWIWASKMISDWRTGAGVGVGMLRVLGAFKISKFQSFKFFHAQIPKFQFSISHFQISGHQTPTFPNFRFSKCQISKFQISKLVHVHECNYQTFDFSKFQKSKIKKVRHTYLPTKS